MNIPLSPSCSLSPILPYITNIPIILPLLMVNIPTYNHSAIYIYIIIYIYMICMYIYIYIHIKPLYIYISKTYISQIHTVYDLFFLCIIYLMSFFFRAVWHHITSQSQQVMYYTSQLISWTLGQLAPWRKIRETCETDIHTRRIYIYMYVYVYIFIYGTIYIYNMYTLYIYIYIWMI